jgi:hypothetical protein
MKTQERLAWCIRPLSVIIMSSMSADIDAARHAHNTPSDLEYQQHTCYKNLFDSVWAHDQSSTAKGFHLTKVELTFATPSGKIKVHGINNLRNAFINTLSKVSSNASAPNLSSAESACESGQEYRKRRESLERSVASLMIDVRNAYQLLNLYHTARISVPIFHPPAAHAQMVATEAGSVILGREARGLTKL